MRTLSRGSLRVAAKSLRAHKGRSLLTMLGIIIGVSSVITVVSIGQGIKHQVVGQIGHVGKDLITIRPGNNASSAIGDLKFFTGPSTSGSLSPKDLQAITKTSGVAKAVPLAVIGGTVQAERGVYGSGAVVATDDQFASVLNQGMAYGSFFTGDDDSGGAVLGAQAATAMFKEVVPLGQTFTFRGQQFIVRGVLNDFANAPLADDVNFNNAIFIPTASGLQLTNDTATTYEILAKPSDSQHADVAARHVQSSLLKLHGDSHDFTVLKQSDSLAATNRVLTLLTQLVTGAAAISLLVGGVGIMNIMLVSVTERMHEIGIRKAVGATNRQILSEFMSEAIVLSFVGVLIGVLIALVVDVVLRITTSFAPIVQWQVVVLAAIVSICTGVIFGSAPALKAARKDPIAALRGE